MSERPTYRISETTSVTLDLIRWLAAEAVLIGHLFNGTGIAPFLLPPNFAYIQNIAVVVFFLLSGFIISYTVFNRRNQPDYTFTVYFVDRFFRIFTAYLPALVFVLVVDGLFQQIAPPTAYDPFRDSYNLPTFVVNGFMFQHYPLFRLVGLDIITFGSARPFWTLAIEWWIYLAFGWLMLAQTVRIERPRLFWVVLLFFGVVPAYNLVRMAGGGLTVVWLVGMAVYITLSRDLLPRFSARGAAALAAFCLMLAIIQAKIRPEAYDLLFGLLLAAAFTFLLCATNAGRFVYSQHVNRLIRWLANSSYSLYLTHHTIVALAVFWNREAGEPVPPLTLFISMTIFCNLLAFGFASLTENHHKRLANWFKGRLQSRAAPVELPS